MVHPCAGYGDVRLFARLAAALPAGRLLTAPAQLAGYETDGIGYKRHRPDAVAIPAHAGELVALLRVLHGEAVPFTLRGAGTSLSGGPVAAQGGLIIHTSRLRRIDEINPRDLYAVVESGVVLNRLGAALKPLGLLYPPDPSSGAACTLGGNVAANAGGAHCFRYGVTGNYVLGVEAVLLDGTVVRLGGPGGGKGAWRDDWKRLLVGSEGTLGALTRLWLRLAPLPGKAWTFRATFRDVESASAAIQSLASHPAAPAAIELMDPRFVDLVENSPMAVGLPRGCFLLLTELEGPAPLVDRWVSTIEGLLRDHGAIDVASGDQPDQRDSLWRARKVAGGLMGQVSPDYLVQDAVIPRSQLAAMLELIYSEADAVGIPAINVFHAGDGNLHPNFLFDSRQPEQVAAVERISHKLMHHVIAVGGTLSGEHGIGDDKTAYTAAFFGQMGCAMQLAVPRVFNPRHQLNPLKVFPERRFA
jgi:glycolate oxidase subunit GlcD